MKQIDRKVLLALSAPAGFVIFSAIFYYGIKRLGFLVPFFKLQTMAGAEIFVILPTAAVLGSYVGERIARDLMKQKDSLLRLTLGAILGYELGAVLEFALFFWLKMPPVKPLLYFSSVVVLLCGFIGALLGIQLTKAKE